MVRPNRLTRLEHIEDLYKGLYFLKVRARSSILFAKESVELRIECIVRVISVHEEETQLFRSKWEAEQLSLETDRGATQSTAMHTRATVPKAA